jgi:hypothetical protein
MGNITVDIFEDSWKRKDLIWILLGPLCLITTLSILFLRLNESLIYLPLFSIAGITSCWLWKWRGLSFIAAFLFSWILYRFLSLHFSNVQTLWELGMGISLTLGFLITKISLEHLQESNEGPAIKDENTLMLAHKELSVLRADLETYKQIQLDNNEKIAKLQSNIQNKDVDLLKREDSYQKNLIEAQEQIKKLNDSLALLDVKCQQNQNKECEFAKVENSYQEKIIEYQNEIETLKQQASQLQNDKATLEIGYKQNQLRDQADLTKLKIFLQTKTADFLKQEDEYQKSVKKYKEEIDNLASQLCFLKDERIIIENTFEQIRLTDTQSIENLKNYIATKEKEFFLKEETFCENLRQYEEEIEKLKLSLKELKNEKPEQHSGEQSLWQAKRKAEGLYYQLREQFEQKSTTLDQTRHELFHTNEVLLKMQKVLDEKEIYALCEGDEMMLNHIITMEKHYQRIIEQLEKETEVCHHLLDQMINHAPLKL